MLRLLLPVLFFLAWSTPAHADVTARRIDALMRAESFKVRLKAARALGRSAHRAALKPLTIAAEDPHPLVRAAVAKALGRYQAPAAMQRLCHMRKDRDALVRQTAGKTVAARGGADRCQAAAVKVRFKVTGGDPGLQAMVLGGLRQAASTDPAVQASEDDAAGLELLVRLGGNHRHHARGTDIRCKVTQSVVALPNRALRAPALTLNANMQVQGRPLPDAAVPGQMRACVSHLVPQVFASLVDYVERAR